MDLINKVVECKFFHYEVQRMCEGHDDEYEDEVRKWLLNIIKTFGNSPYSALIALRKALSSLEDLPATSFLLASSNLHQAQLLYCSE